MMQATTLRIVLWRQRMRGRSIPPQSQYMGKSEVMDDTIASFAMTYAARTTIDHAALVRAKTNRDGKKLKLVAA
jgi:hypothetical protein